MHPARSVIFFTTASGAGYGLLIWLGLFAALGWLPDDSWFAFVAFFTAFALVTGGLLSSTFHLGHPERAWRAMSQWRSSWLSREGVLALATYVPAGLSAAGWVLLGRNDGVIAGLGVAGAILSLMTVYCTSMIYASLRTIRAWHTNWTPAAYVVFALMTGAILLNVFAHLWHGDHVSDFGGLALVTIALGFLVKCGYWRFLDTARSPSTAQTATGLGDPGSVRLLDPPHTQDNYLLQEMGFAIARKHAVRLRCITFLAAFIAPFLFTTLALYAGGTLATVLAALAAFSAGVGIVIERWLFFAEAQHVVTLYYGRETA